MSANPVATTTAYLSVVGFSGGMLLTLLLFVSLLGRRITIQGADAVRYWIIATVGTLVASTMLNMPRLSSPSFYVLHLFTFALLYLSNFQFQTGFLVLHQLPRQRGVLMLGAALLMAYAVLLSFRNEFWIRLAASATMQSVVWIVSIVCAARVAFRAQQRALSPWLSLIGVSLALAGALLRLQAALTEPVVEITLRAGGFDVMRDYGCTLGGIMLGSLGLVLGCFEKVLDLTRHAETTDVLTGLPNRRRELFGRYSDENFCLICPDASDALAEGMRLQQRVHDHDFWRVGKISISIGLVSLPLPAGAMDWPELVRQAGQALNQSKRLGGGRCLVYAGLDVAGSAENRPERLPA